MCVAIFRPSERSSVPAAIEMRSPFRSSKNRLEPALGTEAAPHAGLGAVPLERVLGEQAEIFLAAGGRGDEVAAAAPTLLAMTADDVAQLPLHAVAHLPAHAAAGGDPVQSLRRALTEASSPFIAISMPSSIGRQQT